MKFDNATKDIMFTVYGLTYTKDEQCNITLTGPSSIGKTWLALRTAWYFTDVRKLSYASPQSFFHDPEAIYVDENFQVIDFAKQPRKPSKHATELEKEEYAVQKEAWRQLIAKSKKLLDLSKKIVIFKDQPHYKLLERIRGVLSHDEEYSEYAITDRSEKFGLRTKKVNIKGFFTAVFCTAHEAMKEQEATRMYILTAGRDQWKLHETLKLIATFNSDPKFREWLEKHAKRNWLKERVRLIKEANISKIFIPKPLMEQMLNWFFNKHPFLQPRNQRDFPRFLALAKGWALLNYWTRKDEIVGTDKILWCNKTDMEIAKVLYEQIAESNERGLSPDIYQIFKEVIQKNMVDEGLTRKDIIQLHFQIYGQPLSYKRLTQVVLPQLTGTGLLEERKDQENKRTLRYFTIKYIPPISGVSEIFPEKVTHPTDVGNIISKEFTPEVQHKYETGPIEEIETMIQNVKHGPIPLTPEESEASTRRLSSLAEAGLKLKEFLED